MKTFLQPYILFFIIPIVLGLQTGYAQNNFPKKPQKETSVYDGAQILSNIQQKVLEQKLIKYNDSTSTQIVVATINTLGGRDISLYATEWAHKWGIGQKGKDNGVFVLVAVKDRKITIRTGYGVEHLLTDAYSRRIIEQVIKPEFKQEHYYRGLDKGTTYIIKALQGEFKSDHTENDIILASVFWVFLIIIVIIIIISKNKGNDGGRRRYSGSIFDTIILSNQGRGGFGGSSGGSFGGGGFSGGFGGGGFGGGGASGSW